MDYLIRLLIEQLVAKGVNLASISAFIRDVAGIIAAKPHMGLSELNRRLQMAGWNFMELDDFTLELIAVNFERDLSCDPVCGSRVPGNLSPTQETEIERTDGAHT